jgi:hypothetical protein
LDSRWREDTHGTPDIGFSSIDENRNGKLQPWDHVGIYSGNGYLIHASSYFGEVVESKMKYIHGFWGERRIER